MGITSNSVSGSNPFAVDGGGVQQQAGPLPLESNNSSNYGKPAELLFSSKPTTGSAHFSTERLRSSTTPPQVNFNPFDFPTPPIRQRSTEFTLPQNAAPTANPFLSLSPPLMGSNLLSTSDGPIRRADSGPLSNGKSNGKLSSSSSPSLLAQSDGPVNPPRRAGGSFLVLGGLKPPPRHRRARSNNGIEPTVLEADLKEQERIELEKKWREEKEQELKEKLEMEVREKVQRELREQHEAEKRKLIAQNSAERIEPPLQLNFVNSPPTDPIRTASLGDWWASSLNVHDNYVDPGSGNAANNHTDFNPFAFGMSEKPVSYRSVSAVPSGEKNPFISEKSPPPVPKRPSFDSATTKSGELSSFFSLRTSNSAPINPFLSSPVSPYRTVSTSPSPLATVSSPVNNSEFAFLPPQQSTSSTSSPLNSTNFTFPDPTSPSTPQPSNSLVSPPLNSTRFVFPPTTNSTSSLTSSPIVDSSSFLTSPQMKPLVNSTSSPLVSNSSFSSPQTPVILPKAATLPSPQQSPIVIILPPTHSPNSSSRLASSNHFSPPSSPSSPSSRRPLPRESSSLIDFDAAPAVPSPFLPPPGAPGPTRRRSSTVGSSSASSPNLKTQFIDFTAMDFSPRTPDDAAAASSSPHMFGSEIFPGIDGRRNSARNSSKQIHRRSLSDAGIPLTLLNMVSPRPTSVEVKYLKSIIDVQGVVRGWLARRKLVEAMQRKQKVVQLLDYERAYNNDLVRAIQVYLQPLKKALDAGGSKIILPAQDIQSIFLNFEEILRMNEKIVRGLQQIVKNWNIFKSIGSCYLDPEVELAYDIYIAGHQSSVRLAQSRLDKKTTTPAFKKFITDVDKKSSKSDVKDVSTGAKFLSALRLPADHLTGLINFIKDVRANTYAKHRDVDFIRAWVAKCEQFSSIEDESMRQDNSQKRKLESLSEVVDKLEPKDKSLVVPGRELMCEGEIRIVGGKMSVPKHRYFFLFNDIMLLTKKKPKKPNKYGLKTIIQLRTARSKDIPDCHNFCGLILLNAWELHTPKKSIIMFTETPEQKEIVSHFLENAFQTLHDKGHTKQTS